MLILLNHGVCNDGLVLCYWLYVALCILVCTDIVYFVFGTFEWS